MNLQEHIRRVLKEETNIKTIIHKFIKDGNLSVAIDVVGGFDKLCEIMGIKKPMDLLNLYNDLEVAKSNEDPDLFLFRNKIGDNYFIYERRSDYIGLYMGYIPQMLVDHFGLTVPQIRQLINKWLRESLNLKPNSSSGFDIRFPHMEWVKTLT
jgi:hypothetical protein